MSRIFQHRIILSLCYLRFDLVPVVHEWPRALVQGENAWIRGDSMAQSPQFEFVNLVVLRAARP